MARSVEQSYSAAVEKMRDYNRKSINTGQAKPMGDFATAAATIGVTAAGVALFEVALIPGIAIGAVAVLAPKYVPKLKDRAEYCRLFKTPSLRNVALRRSIFHNGVFHTLRDAVAF
jgi:cytochrome c peroxidase